VRPRVFKYRFHFCAQIFARGVIRYSRISRKRRKIQMTARTILSTINGFNQLTDGAARGNNTIYKLVGIEAPAIFQLQFADFIAQCRS